MKPKLALIGSNMLRKVLNREFLRKAVSAVIGAIIIAGVFIIVLFPLMNYTMNAFQRQEQMFQALRSRDIQKTLEEIKLTKSGNYIYINNTGPVRSGIKYLLIEYEGNTYFVDVYGFHVADEVGDDNLMYPLKLVEQEGMINVSTGTQEGYIILEPKGYMKIEMLEPSVNPLGIITVLGNYFPYKEEEVAPVAGSVVVTPISLGSSIEGLINREDIEVDQELLKTPTEDDPGRGMKRYNKHCILIAEYNDVDIVTGRFGNEREMRFGNAFIGIDPQWTKIREGNPKYAIMLTGPYEPWSDEAIIEIYDGTNKYKYNLDSDYPYGWRVKIYGFTPEHQEDLHLYYDNHDEGIYVDAYGMDTLGLWWLYASSNSRVGVDDAYIFLKGHADQVKIYGCYIGEEEFSYEPFLFFGDFDNNGVSEMVFITEDVNCGDIFMLNDVVGWFVLDDWSVSPLVLKLVGYRIRSDDYAMVQIAIRMFFHDNLGGDTSEVENTDRILFGVYLIDAETGDIVSSREYIYQELDDLEDTYPPNKNYYVQTISLIIPEVEGREYYIAIAFQDPYSNYKVDDTLKPGFDDGDFIIGIEFLGVVYFARP